MRVLVTGICGFAGCELVESMIRNSTPGNVTFHGLDNLSRAGSWLNWDRLKRLGVRTHHGDIRNASDLESLEPVDWVIDAAANPSVLAGVDGKSSSRQLLEHNLIGTINMLEYCKRVGAGFILLSTSRVYSITALAGLDIISQGRRFVPNEQQKWPLGVSNLGVSEAGPVDPPLSLYGASKLASENLAQEYAYTFNLPLWINRCGVMAGAGQFGRSDQGIFSYWIHSWLRQQPLRFLGFGGEGFQVRDCFHPQDLAGVLLRQMNSSGRDGSKVLNFSGGLTNSMSLAELSDWCSERFGKRTVTTDPATRPYDIPWLVLDHRQAKSIWEWQPETKLPEILEGIARHAEANPNWLELSSS